MTRTKARRLAGRALAGVVLAVVALVALQAAHGQDPGNEATGREAGASGVRPLLRPATFEQVYARVAPAVVIVFPEGALFVLPTEWAEVPEEVPGEMWELLDPMAVEPEQREAEPELDQLENELERGPEPEPAQDELEQPDGTTPDLLFDVKDRPRMRQAVSSGFIVDGRGYVITNERVAADAWPLHVLLSDGTVYEGRVLGKDPLLGIALVKIVVPEEENAREFPVVELGDSARVRPGAWVAAFGRSVGFRFDEPEPVMTVGIVAGLNRAIGRASAGPLAGRPRFLGLMQTDALIEAGSAGGPLVNTEGKVVGVTIPGAIVPEQARSQGQCNFAVPINVVGRKIPALAEGAGVAHPMKYGTIGARLQDLHEMYAEVLYLQGKRGVFVKHVLEGGAAAEAGMEGKDVIFSVNSQRVVNTMDFINIVAHLPVGEPATFEVWRVVDDRPRTMMFDVTPVGKTLEEIEAGEPE